MKLVQGSVAELAVVGADLVHVIAIETQGSRAKETSLAYAHRLDIPAPVGQGLSGGRNGIGRVGILRDPMRWDWMGRGRVG